MYNKIHSSASILPLDWNWQTLSRLLYHYADERLVISYCVGSSLSLIVLNDMIREFRPPALVIISNGGCGFSSRDTAQTLLMVILRKGDELYDITVVELPARINFIIDRFGPEIRIYVIRCVEPIT